jgi:hypothetical protein
MNKSRARGAARGRMKMLRNNYKAMSEAAFSVLNSEDPPARGAACGETRDPERRDDKSENET